MNESASHPTRRFSTRVPFYVRARPHYPPALIDFFRDELHLQPNDAVADIASGTGFLTELFVANGNPTYAVEPNAEMRAAAEAALASNPNFHSIDATAEATTLPSASVRLVTAAQAVHWFNLPAAAAEFRRILASGGAIAIVWNKRQTEGSPVADAYRQLIEAYRPADHVATADKILSANAEALRPLFGSGGFATRRFGNPQRLDQQGLLDRITSSSYMPLPDDPRYPRVAAAAERLFEKFQEDGRLTIPQETLVFFGWSGA